MARGAGVGVPPRACSCVFALVMFLHTLAWFIVDLLDSCSRGSGFGHHHRSS